MPEGAAHARVRNIKIREITVKRKTITATLLITWLLLAFGCASNNPALMVPDELEVKEPYIGQADIIVVGSNERIVPNAAFKQAIEFTLAESGLFVGEQTAYRLNVSVLSIKNPAFGLNLKSELRVKWVLYDLHKKAEIFNEIFANEYTATVGDHFVAAQRLKIANDNAVKENIKMALEKIGAGRGKDNEN